jgi:hypothetical protein
MGAKLLVGDLAQGGRGKGKCYLFHCPGCGHGHAFFVREDGGRPSWTFDGNMEAPTFAPSLLNTCELGEERRPHRCHLFLRAGVVEFLSDCTHEYAGKRYPLPDADKE